MKSSVRSLAAFVVLILLGARAFGQHTERVSLSSTETQADDSSAIPSVSADGRFVVFHSSATNLVPGDTNAVADVFVRDIQLGTTERASVSTGGSQGNGSGSFGGAITPDGRFIVFGSASTNLVAGDTNAAIDVFVRDRQTGSTERVSVATGGVESNDESNDWMSISSDGRYVAFGSAATNLVAGDTNGIPDIFVRDRQSGTTKRVSVATGGTQSNGDSSRSFLSGDGRFVAFLSGATTLVAGDTNGDDDIFVHDRQTLATERVNVGSGGAQANGDSNNRPSISSDGRYVEFDSQATNLVPGDTNTSSDVFVHDRQTATTQRVSVGSGGVQANSTSLFGFISADGLHVAFSSFASNLVAGDANGTSDVFVHDVGTGTTELATVSSSGTQGNAASDYAAVSAEGHFVVFKSGATNLVPGDTNGTSDVFLHARAAVGFTSLCDPGVAGVIPCPCSNPPGGPNRGCNNSSATGGANLSTYGAASLSTDTLVFTTAGQRSTALSILAQWVGGSASGVTFGMGVRCTSGALKRLFSKSASGGSITVPVFGAGDPTVSARSAAKGDTILAGQNRWYVVYYRDNTILGGCPASSNFNATQTGRVAWTP